MNKNQEGVKRYGKLQNINGLAVAENVNMIVDKQQDAPELINGLTVSQVFPFLPYVLSF